MRPSRHNILITTRHSGKTFIINLLTGHADLLSTSEAERFKKGKVSRAAEYRKKGYSITEAEETFLFRKAYLNFLDEREQDEVQLFFIPTYGCNFSCAYCYQSGYSNKADVLKKEVTDAFFAYVNSTFSNRKPYITLFGGEPLLMGSAHYKAMEYFLQRCAPEKIPLAVVTNGFYLSEYLDLLKTNILKEIQVTLDGTEVIHNARRRLKNGNPTFERIVAGIDRTLEAGIPLNLRMVADKENINYLPDLSRFAVHKGWTRNPLFKTQIGRNYELHYCQDIPEKLMSRIALWEKVYELAKQYPEIAAFHQPAFSVSKFLFENGELPGPLFDSCPGCKTEWAFDYAGSIYSCTATAGKKELALGTFFPEVSLNNEQVVEWESRDVLSIPECRECNLQLACGGGCAAVALNKTGRLKAPDCRPVKELLGLGMEYYFV